jgi:hypothetical protein
MILAEATPSTWRNASTRPVGGFTPQFSVRDGSQDMTQLDHLLLRLD